MWKKNWEIGVKKSLGMLWKKQNDIVKKCQWVRFERGESRAKLGGVPSKENSW